MVTNGLYCCTISRDNSFRIDLGTVSPILYSYNQNKVTFQSVLPIQVVATLLDAVIIGHMITALETTFLKNREWRI